MKKGLYVSEQPTGFIRLSKYLQTYSLELVEEKVGIDQEFVQFVLLDCLEASASLLVHNYRKKYPRASILVLSMKRDESDILQSLALGADDYQVKPCSDRQVAARLRVMLKRKEAATEQRIQPLGPYWENDSLLEWEGMRFQLHLTKTESKLLHYLIANSKSITTRQQIIHAVWGGQVELSNKVLDVHLFNLRRKLQEATDGSITIKTVTNKGFYIVYMKE